MPRYNCNAPHLQDKSTECVNRHIVLKTMFSFSHFKIMTEPLVLDTVSGHNEGTAAAAAFNTSATH